MMLLIKTNQKAKFTLAQVTHIFILQEMTKVWCKLPL